MIDVRARADFQADFPDDGVEDESGFLLFPGKDLASVIAEMLRRVGCEVSDPKHAGEHGWELDVEFRTEGMWCQVTSVDVGDYILLVLDGAFMGNSSGKPAYLEALAKLNLEMQRDPRFRDIRWHRWRDSEGPAADTPLDVDVDQLPKPEPRRAWFGWGAKKEVGETQGAAQIRNKAKIATNFPDDGTIQQDGAIIRWGGRGVAVAIAEILKRLGAEVSEPASAQEHGWVLDIRCEGSAARCQIEDGGGFVYLDIDDRSVVDLPAYVELVAQLNAELHRDSRFHQIRWYRRDEINMRALASDRPVEPAP